MMRFTKIFLLLFIVLFSKQAIAQRVFILIHGTWAQKSNWHMSGGEFFDSLKKTIDPSFDKIVSFLWSGSLGHSARLHGAEALVLLIKSYPVDTEFVIVGHSHGANVGLLAVRMLGNDVHNKHGIKHFITLGVPVDDGRYDPDMNVIRYLYNLFSFNDLVQTIFGKAKREFCRHKRIANLCITLDGVSPNHRSLRSGLIAQWIPHLDQYQKSAIFDTPGYMHFTTDNEPRYEKDLNRGMMLEEDNRFNQMLMAAVQSFEDDGQHDQEYHLQAGMNQVLQTIWQVQQLH